MNASYTEIFLAGCILILPFLYESSHVFRYHLKFFIYYTLVMFVSLMLMPFFAVRPKNVRNLVVASFFLHHVSTILGLRWILRGKEYLEKDQSYIIVSNHQSALDILGMFDFWHVMDKCTVVAKKELFYFWPFGLGAWLCGLIFIPRMNGAKAQQLINEAARKIKKDRIKLWIFPEGTRRNTGHIHPFKKGAFHLAISSKIPILPIVFSQYYFLDKESRRFDHGKVVVTCLPPISTDNLTVEEMEEVMEQTRAAMATTFHEVNKEIKDSMSFSSHRI